MWIQFRGFFFSFTKSLKRLVQTLLTFGTESVLNLVVSHPEDLHEKDIGTISCGYRRLDLDHLLLSPGDDAISILSFAVDACGEGRRKKFCSA